MAAGNSPGRRAHLCILSTRTVLTSHRGAQGPGVAADQPLTHRVVAEELTVAAVTELPVFLVGGGGGAGTAL